jgi:D-glycero-alpha-D-manno-heptose-7-phosphate kinase
LIVTRTPHRISFFGGATDFPEWYLEHGGAVLSAAIDKYCYISCRRHVPFSAEQLHRVVWSHIENVSTVAEILHPAVREALPWLGFGDDTPLEIHHQTDLRARAGIGSSSAFAVGLIHALMALGGQRPSRHELALKAIELEREVMGDRVGCQDQTAAAHGGLNVIHFRQTGAIDVEPIALSDGRAEALTSRLLLLYTGSSRLGPRIAESVLSNLSRQSSVLMKMRDMVDTGRSILEDGDLDDFGRLLDEAWVSKRELASQISTPSIDAVYETALKAGALGGKLLGAGGTGFMVFYVPPDRRTAVSRALEGMPQVPFGIDTGGTRLLIGDDG